MIKAAIFPGTFDPPTLGHLDVIERAAYLFDMIYVAIGQNSQKIHTAFTVAERLELLRQMTSHLKHIKIVAFEGLLVDYAKQVGISTIIRSVRQVSDFDFEWMQAEMNRQLGSLETIFLLASEKYRSIHSHFLREIAMGGRRLDLFVPQSIENKVFERLSNPQIADQIVLLEK
jgi:pantetheine-phosphate adenylyltransferase